jgi:hypothetical protein
MSCVGKITDLMIDSNAKEPANADDSARDVGVAQKDVVIRN